MHHNAAEPPLHNLSLLSARQPQLPPLCLLYPLQQAFLLPLQLPEHRLALKPLKPSKQKRNERKHQQPLPQL